MKNPYKVIFKYKNLNNEYQYNVYIFVGKITNEIKIIINKFQNLNLLDTLKKITISDANTLKKLYGSKWYSFFFVYDHIIHTMNNLLEKDKKFIKKKLGDDFFFNQRGGSENTENKNTNENNNEDNNEEDLNKLYNTLNSTYNTKLTDEANSNNLKEVKKKNNLIEKLIDKEKIKKTNNISNIQKFDNSNYKKYEEQKLFNVYTKVYITNYFIFNNDNILNIKEKICTCIKNTSYINDDCYILPTRQFLYSKYIYNNKLNYICLGHSFYLNNEEYKNIVDVIPNNNLQNYYLNYKKYSEQNSLFKLNYLKLNDENNKIIIDYIDNILNNDIYLIDIYNDIKSISDIILNETELTNLYYNYIYVYFPYIKKENINEIINYIKKQQSNEYDLIKINYNKIKLELFTKYKQTDIYSNILYNYDTYKYFKNYYITLIDVKIRLSNNPLNIYLIFENIIPSINIPFVRYNQKINKSYLKIFPNNIKKDNELYNKWIKNVNNGLTIKVLLKKYNKYVTLKIQENGICEYSSHWKDNEMITLENIYETYPIIISILKEFKNYSNIEIIPNKKNFYIEFLNAFQIFEIPDNKAIDLKYLEKYSTYYNNYISIIKNETNNKYMDNFFIYKKISQYEDLLTNKIESNIINILKNYNFNNEQIIEYLYKQLNMEKSEIRLLINDVKSKYKIKKNNKNINNNNLIFPTFKEPGISIKFHSLESKRKLIRITGCNNINIFFNLLDFLSVFIYSFVEIYIKNKLQNIKNELESITNVILKFDKIRDIQQIESKLTNIKKLTLLDKERFGFTPNKGENNYSRMCLKEHQPQGFREIDIEKIKTLGYKYDESEKTYVYDSVLKKKKNNKYVTEKVKLKAIKLKNKSTNENIYYICHPSFNKKNYQFISFQDLDKHPDKMCMPCCTKHIQLESNKANIRNRYLQCTNQEYDSNIIDNNDILYILKDTNKLSNNKLAILPDHLDIFLNNYSNRKIVLKKNQFLYETYPDYFFKIGIEKSNNTFLDCIEKCLNISKNEILKKLIDNLENNEPLFISLNNGNIKNLFSTIQNFIQYIKYGKIDYKLIIQLLSVPNIIDKNGLNIYIFKRYISKTKINETNDDDDNVTENIDNIEIECINHNELYLTDPKRKNIILLYENNIFNPIILVKKANNSKNISKFFWFFYTKTNIINNILKFYKISCNSTFNYYNTSTILKVNNYSIYLKLKNTKFEPIGQFIDYENKAYCFLLKNKKLLYFHNTACLNNLKILNDINKYLYSFNETYNFLMEINDILNLDYKPKRVLYKDFIKNKYSVYYIETFNKLNFKIKPELIDSKILNKLKINSRIIFTLYTEINKEISNKTDIFDNRIFTINKNDYENELYELLRFHLSYFFIKNMNIKNNILKLLNDKSNDNKSKIYDIIYKIILDEYFLEDKIEKKILEKKSNKNKRVICDDFKKDECLTNNECFFEKNKCKLKVLKNKLNFSINKIINELITNDIKRNEILVIERYRVSDIIDYNKFTERENQLIIREDDIANLQKLKFLFGKNIKLKLFDKKQKIKNYENLNIINKLIYYKSFFIQKIISNNNTLYRAISNCIFWIKNKYENINFKNLGYISENQTIISNFIKKIIIDNIYIIYKKKNIKSILDQYFKNIDDYTNSLYNSSYNYSKIIPDILALNNYYNIAIYLYDYNYEIIYIINNLSIIYNYKNKKKYDKLYDDIKFKNKSINLKIDYLSKSNFIENITNIYSMYYV